MFIFCPWRASPCFSGLQNLASSFLFIFIFLVTPIHSAEPFGLRKSHLSSFCDSLARRGTSWDFFFGSISAYEPNLQSISSFHICMSYSFFIWRTLTNKQRNLNPDVRNRLFLSALHVLGLRIRLER